MIRRELVVACIMDMWNISSVLSCFILYLHCVTSLRYYVTLSHNGPVVKGANITLKAELYNGYGQPPNGTFSYAWKDDVIGKQQHMYKTDPTNATVVYWNVSYPSPDYVAGSYETAVRVLKKEFIFVSITRESINYIITDELNGKMVLEQPGGNDASEFVSSAHQVTHRIVLSSPDHEFLSRNATNVLTFWFIDCVYYGYSTNYTFHFNYTEKRSYNVQALVVASFDNIVSTTVSPPTTSSTLTTEAPAPMNSTNTTVTTATPPVTTVTTRTIVTTTPAPPNITVYGTIYDVNSPIPYKCSNSSIIPRDPYKVYGFFIKQVTAKAPVANVVVKGNNWLQAGDVLNMSISCNGSSTFYHCLKIKPGTYNITGEEICASELSSMDCMVTLVHYFREPSTYTILSIIRNDVSKVVIPVVIRMYVATKQPQLSVIVVPVTFSVLAVILIIFGVAYFVQSQNRYIVEVADFDFGQASGIEYKTFRERLREGVNNVFNRTNEFKDIAPVHQSRRQYENMNQS